MKPKLILPGDRVRVKGFRTIAVVLWFYTDIKGGVKLDREVGGFRSWNIKDLVRVRDTAKLKEI